VRAYARTLRKLAILERWQREATALFDTLPKTSLDPADANLEDLHAVKLAIRRHRPSAGAIAYLVFLALLQARSADQRRRGERPRPGP
jgi:hypothetical protein